MTRFWSPRAAVFSACAAAVAILPACDGNEVRVPFHHVVPVTGPVTFSLHNTAGTVRIDAWSQPSIDISGEKTGRTEDAANAITIAVKHRGSTVDVSTVYPPGTSSGGAIYVIRLPASTAVTIENAAGSVRVAGTASDVTGTIAAGTLNVTMARLTGSQHVTLSTATGTITLHVPRSADATIATHQTVGSVKTDLPPVLGKGTAHVDLTTTVGSIAIGWSP